MKSDITIHPLTYWTLIYDKSINTRNRLIQIIQKLGTLTKISKHNELQRARKYLNLINQGIVSLTTSTLTFMSQSGTGPHAQITFWQSLQQVQLALALRPAQTQCERRLLLLVRPTIYVGMSWPRRVVASMLFGLLIYTHATLHLSQSL